MNQQTGTLDVTQEFMAETDALSRTFEWVTARPEMFGQIITLLGSLPDQSLPASVAPRVLRMASGWVQPDFMRSASVDDGKNWQEARLQQRC